MYKFNAASVKLTNLMGIYQKPTEAWITGQTIVARTKHFDITHTGFFHDKQLTD
jgi:hypothetical protein